MEKENENVLGDSEDGSLMYFINEVANLREQIEKLREENKRLLWILETQD